MPPLRKSISLAAPCGPSLSGLARAGKRPVSEYGPGARRGQPGEVLGLPDQRMLPAGSETASELSPLSSLLDECCSQNGAMYSVFTRFCENAMWKRNRPMKVHGTSDKSPVVYAVEGDFVTTVFMILDETEKTGWEERNSNTLLTVTQ